MSWPPKGMVAKSGLSLKPGSINYVDKDGRLSVAQQQAAVDAKRGVKVRQKRSHPEDDLQIAVADFLRVATIPPARWWFVPNGSGKFSPKLAAILKRMGLTPGVVDLHFAWDGSTYDELAPRGVFGVIELKVKPNKVTDEQWAYMGDMAAVGHHAAVCWSLEDVKATLLSWGYPMRMMRGV